MRIILLAQLIVPLLLVAWMAVHAPGERRLIVLQAVCCLIVLVALARVGVWMFPPWWTPHVAAAAILLLTQYSIRNASTHARRASNWLDRGSTLVALFLGGVGSWAGLQAFRAASVPDRSSVRSLAFPLAAGRYLVVNGGNVEMINAHRKSADTTNTRLQAWRGNGYAIDIVGIDAVGLRSRGILPEEPHAYVIFGKPVLAPCDGEIVAAVDGLPDMRVPIYDRQHVAGNHVIVECDGVQVVLAHLMRWSVSVHVGDWVSIGSKLGAVGNSGGSDEPHLHIHAQRPGSFVGAMDGDPVPMILNGRYLVRGDRVVVAGAAKMAGR